MQAQCSGGVAQQRLGLAVDPMQILDQHQQRLVHRLAQHQAFDGFVRAPAAQLRLHLRERVVALDQTQQGKEIRQRIFQ